MSSTRNHTILENYKVLYIVVSIGPTRKQAIKITCKKQSQVAVIFCTMYKLCYVVALFFHQGAPVLSLEKT